MASIKDNLSKPFSYKAIAGDAISFIISPLISLIIRTQRSDVFFYFLPFIVLLVVFSLIVKPATYLFFGLYKEKYNRMSLGKLKKIFLAGTISSFIVSAIMLILDNLGVFAHFSWTVILIDWVFSMFIVIELRTGISYIEERKLLVRRGSVIASFLAWIDNNKKKILILAFIFSLSFIIRLIGVRFSEPLLTYWNELSILDPVFKMTIDRSLNSNKFNRPDQILHIVNFFYLNIISLIRTGYSFEYAYQTNPYDYFVCARMLTILAGSFIPIVAYKIGEEAKPNFSLPAALIFAVFPLHVLYSHYVSPDIPITLFTLLIILFSIRYMRSKTNKHLLLAVIFAAINTAEKYPGLLSFSIPAISVLWVYAKRHKGQPLMIFKNTLLEWLKCFGIFLLALYLVAPNLFIQFGQVISTITYESRSSHLGADGLTWGGNMKFYVLNFLTYNHPILAASAILGLIVFFLEKQYYLIAIFYGLFYWITMSKLGLHWERWALPMHTFPLLLAAFGFSWLWSKIKKRSWIKMFTAGLFGLSIIWAFLFSLSISIRMTYTDTRYAAYRYCEDIGITVENSLSEGYTPFSPGGSNIILLSEINPQTRFVILSSKMYDRFFAEPQRYKAEIEQYQDIEQNFSLIKTFTPTPNTSSSPSLAWIDDLRYYLQKNFDKDSQERFTGPTIQIYQID